MNRKVENKNSLDYSMTSEEIVFLQKQPPKVFCKKDAFRNFAKFTGKHLCQSQASKFIGKETLVHMFSCEF